MTDLLAPRWARPAVQLVGAVRKELVDVVRQPRLIALLVLGPFLILVVFAVGYDTEETDLTTAFVGPEGAVYEDAIETYSDSLRAFLEPVGYSSDIVAAQAKVESGEIDLVVQFPPDPRERILAGEQAIINVFHEKLDPVQGRSVEIAAQLAVLELNAEILERVLAEGSGDQREPVDQGVGEIDERVEAIRAAVDADDVPAAQQEAAELETALGEVERVSASSVQLARQLGGELSEEEQGEVDALGDVAGRMADSARRIGTADDDDLAAVRAATRTLEADRDELRDRSEGLLVLDPAVLVRPFRSDAENLQREGVDVQDFFAPNTIVLLLAHLALTIAAMGLVRGEALGLFEVFRVGPVGTRSVLAGAYTSHLLVGSAAAAAVTAGLVALLGVPLRGHVAYLALGLGLVLAASIGLGLVVALVSRSDTQAVQLSMLVLLAGLFFGGFFIDLDLMREPVRWGAAVLPVTHGIGLAQDVMLRGDPPQVADVLGLVATTLAYGLLAAVLLRRRLLIRDREDA